MTNLVAAIANSVVSRMATRLAVKCCFAFKRRLLIHWSKLVGGIVSMF